MALQDLWFPRATPVQLGTRLRELCTDRELWTRMSSAALARVREQFTWEQVGLRALHAYAGERDADR